MSYKNNFPTGLRVILLIVAVTALGYYGLLDRCGG